MRLLVASVLTCALLFGCDEDGLIWMPLSNRADPLFRVVIRNRAGFIDSSGKIVIPPTLRVESNWSQVFYDGLRAVGASSGPFLDKSGQKVLDNRFDRIWDFSEGLAVASKTSDSMWGYIDHAGKFVIPPQFPVYPEGLVDSFSDGVAAVEISGKLGYIDRSGAFIIPRQFVAGTPFENGIARVVAEGPCAFVDFEAVDPCMQSPRFAPSTGIPRNRGPNLPLCKWKFIDKSGKPVVKAQFEGALGFHEGLAAVKSGDLWCFINMQGNFVIPPSFQGASSFADGLALVERDRKVGFIDKTGVMKIRTDKADSFSEGLSAVGDPTEGYIYIDTQGKQAIPERFALASRFFHGRAHVKIAGSGSSNFQGKFAYIDKTGKRIFTYQR